MVRIKIDNFMRLNGLLKESSRERALPTKTLCKYMLDFNCVNDNSKNLITSVNTELDQTRSIDNSLLATSRPEWAKPIPNKSRKGQKYKNHANRQSNGFTLIEVLVVVVMIGIAGSMALPTYRRTLAQGNVDRYTQFVESGLFNLRARLGRTRSSCQINLDPNFTNNKFGLPSEVLEFQGENGARSKDPRLQCCEENGALVVCAADQLAGEKPYRFINLEGTQESKQVELSATQSTYELSPPGTSVSADDLTILIRTVDFDTLDSDLQARLLTRCVSMMGNGLVQAGTWSDEDMSCQSR